MPLPWLIGRGILGGLALAKTLGNDEHIEHDDQDEQAKNKDIKITNLEIKRNNLYLQATKHINMIDDEMESLAQTLVYLLEPFGVNEYNLYWDNRSGRYIYIELPDFNIEKLNINLDAFDILARKHNFSFNFSLSKNIEGTQDYIEHFFKLHQNLTHDKLDHLLELDLEITDVLKILDDQ